ncbi:MAG: NAD(P)H-hydrate epimerase [Pseudomonadota bacterium]
MPRKETITSEEMRSLEDAAISNGLVTGLELMSRAGQGVVEAIIEHWPEMDLGHQCAVILCGPGNNGADGFVVARLLRERGVDVSAHFAGGVERLSSDARANYDRWINEGGQVAEYTQATLEQRILKDSPVLVVDALLGIGQSRDCDPILAPILGVLDSASNLSVPRPLHTVSVDVPTGYRTDTGALLSTNPFEPDLTVTFHRKKPVHDMLTRHGYHVVVKDIGL